MAALADLYPFVLPQVRGCDSDTVDFHLRQAAIEFCRRAQCWRQEIPIQAQANVESYLIPLPADSVASMLLDFELLDSNGLSKDKFHLVNANRGRKLERAHRFSAWVFLSDDGKTISVQPIPDSSTQTLVPYVSLKPAQAAATLPDFLVEENARTIAAGALAELLNLSKVAWANPGKAVDERAKFLSECGVASVRASRGNARSKTRSRGCFF